MKCREYFLVVFQTALWQSISLGGNPDRAISESYILQNPFNKNLKNLKSEDTTYYLAACTIFREEDRFLREWIEFHLCNGFEHFFLFVDRQPNLTCTELVLRPYIDSGFVTLDFGIPVPDPQIPTYDACIQRYGERAHWIAFIDVDEFLFPSDPLIQVIYFISSRFGFGLASQLSSKLHNMHLDVEFLHAL